MATVPDRIYDGVKLSGHFGALSVTVHLNEDKVEIFDPQYGEWRIYSTADALTKYAFAA